MTTFDDRETAFENKFAHDEEMKFNATVRGCRHVALWAADLLDMDPHESERYAEILCTLDLQEPGHADLIKRLKHDLGSRMTVAEIGAKIEEEMAHAMQQVLSDPKLAKL